MTTTKKNRASKRAAGNVSPLVGRMYTNRGEDPFKSVKFEKRDSAITNPDGTVVSSSRGVDIPESWSQLATDIVVSKYFRRAGLRGDATMGETSVQQVIFRIARTIREAGVARAYFASDEEAETFESELAFLLVNQYGAFNSPVWFNLGLFQRYGITGSGGNWAWDDATGTVKETTNAYERPQCSACFIQSVSDDLMSIYDLMKNEARLFKYGSGTGSNFSAIRGRQEKLSGGGTSSGLISFLEVFDRAAGATKSGGTTRRAAKMVCLDMDHPEIVDFIGWKMKEEKKAHALIAAGYPSDFNGEAYRTVGGQNSNNSVRVTDAFMNAVDSDGEWQTRMRTTGEVCETFKARDLWRKIAESAWHCADPGVQYDTTINDWHTCPNSGRIDASNPCSEYMFLGDTACNLSSLNLTKFLRELPNGEIDFDVDGYRHAARVFFVAQEILVDLSSYPTNTIAQNSHDYRPLGLGYANLGTLLMIMGLPYDSDAGRSVASSLTAILTGHAYRVSAEMAAIKGSFAGYAKNREPMLRVMRKHRDAAYKVDENGPLPGILSAAREDWDEAVRLGEKYGYRNAQASVLAPTGCLVAGSLVATDRGLVRIESRGDPDGAQWQDIDMMVQTDDGPRKATKFYVNGVDDVIDVRTERGYRIRGTTKHRVKVVASEGWSWRRFSEIDSGDVVPLAMNQIIGKPIDVMLPPCPPSYRTNHNRGVVTPEKMTSELAELVGAFAANGSLHEKGLRFSMFGADVDAIERYVTSLRSIFGVDPKVTPQGEYTEVAFHSTQVRSWWEACEFSKRRGEKAGKGFTATVPDAILSTNDPSIYGAYLRGIFTCDGTVNVGLPSVTNVSVDFLYDVQTMMLALGVPTRMDDSRGGELGNRTVWRLTVASRLFNREFGERIGFSAARKGDLVQSAGDWSRADFIPLPQSLIDRVSPIGSAHRRDVMRHVLEHAGVARHLAMKILSETGDHDLRHALNFFYDEVASSELAGREPTYDLSVPDNVTYIANGFVSHNTIGLLMDCDTTGIEPDFSIVKYKKLAGGGYFKIVNASVERALKRLGYTAAQSAEIIAYVAGTNSFASAPVVNREYLKSKGFSEADVERIEAALPGSFTIDGAFTPHVLGADLITRLGVDDESKTKGFSLLAKWGLSRTEIDTLGDHVLGRSTVEGAPHLRAEHYAVFDCANRCGKHGTRFIAPLAHLKMMAAAQPFISGAISKTVNVPNEATVEEIAYIYREGWNLGLKAVALYRDGCKASQPLSSSGDKAQSGADGSSKKTETKTEVPVAAVAPTATAPINSPQSASVRHRLPRKRFGFTQEARVAGHKVFLRTGDYEDGKLGEIFIDMHKEGASFRSLVNCLAISVSMGLQHGIELEEYVDQFTFTRFEPQGPVEGHANVKFATSIVDYVFRVLAVEYLNRHDLAHVQPDEHAVSASTDATSTHPVATETRAPTSNPTLGKMMGDAPFCDGCGHVTVRNGTCYRCLNCGNSMGCS